MTNSAAELDGLREVLDLAREQAGAPKGAIFKLTLKSAAWIAGVTESHMRKLCEENVYGEKAHGYGMKRGGRWEVAALLFLRTMPLSALARFRKNELIADAEVAKRA